MGKNGFTGYISWLCEWIMRMAYVNFLWLLFSVFGLVILGVIPATAALFSVQRKWVQGEENIPVFATFWQQYKKNFFKSNLLGILLIMTGWVLYFDLKFFVHKEELIFQFISFVFFILSIWYMIVVMYIFPVYVHYELKLLQNIKFAFSLGILNPLRTLGIIICGGGALFLVLYFPKLLPFFGVSMPCLIIMLFASQAFDKVEKMQYMKDVKVQQPLRNPKQLLAK